MEIRSTFFCDREYFLLLDYFSSLFLLRNENELELFLRVVRGGRRRGNGTIFPSDVEIVTSIAFHVQFFYGRRNTDGTKDQRTVDDARRMNFATHEFFHRCYKFAPFVSNLLYRSRSVFLFFFFFFFTIFFYTQVTKLNKADNDKITR